MTAFLTLGALLVAGAVCFVVPALLFRRPKTTVAAGSLNAAVYRDQIRELDADLASRVLSAEDYDTARRELEARLLHDVPAAGALPSRRAGGRAGAIAAAVTVPVLAIALYLLTGTPQALSPAAEGARGPAHAMDEGQIAGMIERLAARLAKNPDDIDGWVMLARSYGVVGRFADASSAYARAVKLAPNDAQLLADYADALAMAQGQKLDGEPEKLIARALAIDPDNAKALALAGTAAFDRKDYAAAISHWKRIVDSAPADSDFARSIRTSIAEAQALAGQSGPARAAAAPAAPAAPGHGVSGVVRLAPQLAAKVAPTDTVFVYARAAEGPRVPLAVMRTTARELPLEFRLDDAMAMDPSLKLSAFPKIVVSARISKAGTAQPQPGDLFGQTQAIANSASAVSIVIDSETH